MHVCGAIRAIEADGWYLVAMRAQSAKAFHQERMPVAFGTGQSIRLNRGTLVQFSFKPMREEQARQIAAWHYPAPYNFYDLDEDPEDLAEWLDPQSWREPHYAVFDAENNLVGFFSFRQDAQDEQMVEIGLGLRPDLTGKGLGFALLTAGLSFGQAQFPAGKWRLRVATFNQRAIRVYERAGFLPLTTFPQRTNGAVYEFLRMVRTTDQRDSTR